VGESVNLFDQQAANRRRSWWLVAGFVAFFAWLGFGGDLVYHLYTADAAVGAYRHTVPFFGIALTVLAGGMAAYSWDNGPGRVLWSAGAVEITDPSTPEERQLVNVVEEMAIASALARPRIYVVPDDDPNAFATGRGPSDACIAVTRGLLACCSRDELQAVVAHEMGHIKNLDVRLMTLLAALVGTVALISDGLGRTFRTGARVSGGARRGSGRGGKKGGNAGPLVLILLALWLLSWLLAPIITRVLALGVSRKREYLADAMSAQFTRNPMALASALEKIERSHGPTRSISRGAAHLCIADPLGRRVNLREGWLADLWGTHPPMAMRVSRLRAMAFREQKRALRELGTPTAAAAVK
jgi:heat shock protein HtpX